MSDDTPELTWGDQQARKFDGRLCWQDPVKPFLTLAFTDEGKIVINTDLEPDAASRVIWDHFLGMVEQHNARIGPHGPRDFDDALDAQGSERVALLTDALAKERARVAAPVSDEALIRAALEAAASEAREFVRKNRGAWSDDETCGALEVCVAIAQMANADDATIAAIRERAKG